MKTFTPFRLSALTILISIFTITLQAQALDYYIDQNNPIANDINTGTIDKPWSTLTKANQTLTAGDTVYIKAGTYSSYIAPARSGTTSKLITYVNYGTDIVTIQNAAYGILLDGKSYIKIQGIKFSNLDHFMYLVNGANNNIIGYCNFNYGRSNSWTGSLIGNSSSYNWIHHCIFSDYGACVAGYGSGSDQGTTLDIGNEESGTDTSSFNVVEDCTLYHGGHHVMGVFSRYNTIRNNYFHNEAWSSGRGQRNLYLQGYETNSGYTLFEGNKFGYSSKTCNNANPTTGNVKMTTSNNIFRYNSIFFSVATGLYTDSYISQGSQYSTGSNNKIYNNTIFTSGYNIDPSYKGGSEDAAIWFANSVNKGNLIVNNLYLNNNKAHTGNTANQTFANNWNGNSQGDPNFINASTTPPTDLTNTTLPNFKLQSNSPVIDKGGALTSVASATGTGTSVNVLNASYFQDGSYGPPSIVQADWIAVGNTTNVVQITSISGNTINIKNSISWKNGDSVWLYKKSDGMRVLYGAAPDPGAYEFVQRIELPSPTSLKTLP